MRRNVRYHCPFCPGLGLRNDDLALSVSWEKRLYHCFRCGTSGRTDSLPPDFKEPVILREDKKKTEQLDFTDMVSLADSPAGRRYIKGRGLDPGPLENYVFVSKKRLIFPIYGEEGRIVYYVARKMWGAGGRYQNMAAPAHIFIPYGCILPAKSALVVTEGIFDALSVWQWTELPVIALLGMNITEHKIIEILSYSYPHTKIIILLDAGEYKTAWEYYDELCPLRRNISICKLEDGDPNEIGRDRLWKKLMPLVLSDVENTSPGTSLKRNTLDPPPQERYSKSSRNSSRRTRTRR